MPITGSGQIALIADIEAEFDQTGSTDISLFQARTDAGFSAGQVTMFDFYGESDVVVVAPSVTTNASTSVTASSATLSGNVTSAGFGTISSRGFYFGTNASYASNSKIAVSGTTGAYTLARTGLSSPQTYYVTAYAINEIGETRGATLSFQTTYSVTTASQGAVFQGTGGGYGYYHNGYSYVYSGGSTSPGVYFYWTRATTGVATRRNQIHVSSSGSYAEMQNEGYSGSSIIVHATNATSYWAYNASSNYPLQVGVSGNGKYITARFN